MPWYTPLREIKSLGSSAPRPGSLAGLAQARQEHLGQFFTPDPIAALLWRIVAPAMEQALAKAPNGKIAILDSSVGTGRLLQFANPDDHFIAGVDVHVETINALSSVADAAGFESEFHCCGMELINPRKFNVTLINPPFSLHLESPCLTPFDCTTWGKFGPNSSTRSDIYAVAQALDSSEIVVAILPEGAATEIASSPWAAPRLKAVLTLPPGTFREEGTEVKVYVLIFDKEAYDHPVIGHKVVTLADDLPKISLSCGIMTNRTSINAVHGDEVGPVIVGAVTGNPEVRVSHDGRKVKLHFKCAVTQGEVMNAILKDRIETVAIPDHRYPKGTRYSGAGVLDLEAHCIQADPIASFTDFLSQIRRAGGAPVLATGLMSHLRRRAARSNRQKTPFAHVVWDDQGGARGILAGKARKTHLAELGVWGSPVIKAGEEVSFREGEGGYTYKVKDREYQITLDEIRLRFEVPTSSAGWVDKFPGLLKAFPALAEQLYARARTLGIDKWLWGYQMDDLVEVALKPQGATIAWDMGLGKARFAAALILLAQVKTGVIAVEAYLVDEMVTELSDLPIPASDWQVIKDPESLADLRKINIISYSRLRAAVDTAFPRKTYGKALRRRVSLLVADEGHLLRNPLSQQSKALWAISAKRRFCSTGTPIANYPRDVLPILSFTGGDGTAAQPWGWHRGHMTQSWRTSLISAQRGIDAFREAFVTLEWCVDQFREDNLSGAKREIPKIANLNEYRLAIAAHTKRRLTKEPDVVKYVNIADPVERTILVPWDMDHLSHYLAVAEEFSHWFMEMREKSGLRGNSLIAILARIQAVQFACNFPQRPRDGHPHFHGLTSKQRAAIDELERLTLAGHKTIAYAHNPGLLELIHRELSKRGIESLTFHGGQAIKDRTREMNDRFRHGDCPNLLASFGVAQAGLNLWVADRCLLLDRDWAWKTESQAMRRLLRPQQTKEVVVSYFELEGSIDKYQAQLVQFKRSAMLSGLDWGTPDAGDVEFLHLDTILGRFCEDLASLYGVKRHELRDRIAGGGRR